MVATKEKGNILISRFGEEENKMKQDTEKLRKKVANMSREISIRDGKIGRLNTQLQAKEDLIIALRAKEREHMDRMKKIVEELKEEMTNGWTEEEKETFKDYLEKEIKPHWPALYEILREPRWRLRL